MQSQMNHGKLTDREYWEHYWSTFQPAPVEDVFLSELFTELPGPNSTFIEIGGFPGTFSVYFKKFKQYDVTLLDQFVVPETLRQMERVNSLPEGSIKAIETDLLTYEPTRQYDVVFSAGFVEHFVDTRLVLEKHCRLLKDDGTLLVTIPNLRGINGLIQKYFDPSTYRAHNLESMKLDRLKAICASLGLKSCEVFYWGNAYVYLVDTAPVRPATKKLVSAVSNVISRSRSRNRLVTPNIVIKGKK